MSMCEPHGAHSVFDRAMTQESTMPMMNTTASNGGGNCVCIAAHRALVTTAAGQYPTIRASAGQG